MLQLVMGGLSSSSNPVLRNITDCLRGEKNDDMRKGEPIELDETLIKVCF